MNILTTLSSPMQYLATEMMLPFLSFSYRTIYPNYGIAILLLTILIKIVFYPLTKRQFESMKAMQVIQPALKEIQKKYKGQPQQLQSEMMALYKREGVNPFSGCLPLLVQLPFLFALFMAINGPEFAAMISQPGINPGLFSFWLPNLAQADKFLILPILIGITMFWSQKMTITDPTQARIMMLMPVVMFFLFMKLPAGVLLYWAASQVISTAQQLWVMRKPT